MITPCTLVQAIHLGTPMAGRGQHRPGPGWRRCRPCTPCKMARGRVSLISIDKEPGPRGNGPRGSTRGTIAIMSFLKSATLTRLWDDFDAREDCWARSSPTGWGQSAAQRPRPRGGDLLLRLPAGTLATRSRRSAITPPAASRTRPRARCSSNARRGRPASMRSTRSGRIGLLHVAFPLKMMRQPDGHVTSCDLLHTAGRRGHLRHVREPGCPADLDPDPRRRARARSPARPTARSASARRRVCRSISPRSARS